MMDEMTGAEFNRGPFDGVVSSGFVPFFIFYHVLFSLLLPRQTITHHKTQSNILYHGNHQNATAPPKSPANSPSASSPTKTPKKSKRKSRNTSKTYSPP
mmetsp:Transcript_16606/g.34718  ORF Transcript_16606/g.34718 Transcript_16606/m.34718 type:complete len:99 (+) Transcript_16606:1353-1649(+)